MELTNQNTERKRRRPSIDIATMVYGKVPPQARELEEAVIGALLIEKEAIYIVQQLLNKEDFYVDAHQRMIAAIFKIHADGVQPEVLSLVEELKVREELDIVGGPYAIVKLTNNVVSGINITHHCKIIKEKSIKRRLIMMAGDIVAEAYEDSSDAFDVLEHAESHLTGVNTTLAEMKITRVSTLADEIAMDFKVQVDNARNGVVNENEVFTRFKNWDAINGPMFPGVYTVAARPAMGKSAFAAQLVVNIGQEKPIGLINGEMTNKQYLTRIGCNMLQFSNHLWKKNKFDVTDEEINMVTRAMEVTKDLKFHIEDLKKIDLVEAKIKFWVDRYGVKIVLADLLQAFSLSTKMMSIYRSRLDQLNYIMDRFATLAQQCEIPIILFSHINRESEKRGGSKEPTMGDLKGTGNIEDFSYQVSILHRPEVYGIEDDMGESTKGLCYQIITKHRDGDLGRLKHRFHGAQSRFTDWHDDELGGWKPPVYNGATAKPFAWPVRDITQSNSSSGNFDDGFQPVDDLPF